MRVLLLSPSFIGFARGIHLGLGYLGAVLEQNGFEVKIIDVAVQDIDNRCLVSILKDYSPKVIGITAVSANYLDAIDAISSIRQVLGYRVKIILGGPHVTFSAQTILKYHKEIDFCVLGEGEESFLHLVQCIERNNNDYRGIKGIAYIGNRGYYFSGYNKLSQDLNLLPYPARHLYDIGEFPYVLSDKVAKTKNNTELIVSRGCAYNCGFCSTKQLWRGNYRRKTVEKTIAEILYLYNKGFTGLYFNDDIFTLDRVWVLDVCKDIIEKPINITWACGTRVDCVDKELLQYMRRAGCVFINYGVESGSKVILNLQNKKHTIRQVEQAFSLMHEEGIYSSCNLVFGFPGESIQTAKNTINWIKNIIKPDDIWISKACCYPGTLLSRYYGVTADDYEVKINNMCSKGLIYGSGGIYTPFFNNKKTVREIWDYAKSELGVFDLAFGDIEDKLKDQNVKYKYEL